MRVVTLARILRVSILFASGIFVSNILSCVILRNSLEIQKEIYFVVMGQDVKGKITRKMRAIEGFFMFFYR